MLGVPLNLIKCPRIHEALFGLMNPNAGSAGIPFNSRKEPAAGSLVNVSPQSSHFCLNNPGCRGGDCEIFYTTRNHDRRKCLRACSPVFVTCRRGAALRNNTGFSRKKCSFQYFCCEFANSIFAVEFTSGNLKYLTVNCVVKA